MTLWAHGWALVTFFAVACWDTVRREIGGRRGQAGAGDGPSAAARPYAQTHCILPLKHSWAVPMVPDALCPYEQCACAVKLNASRSVTGVLRGYDQFMNVVLDHTQGCAAMHLPRRLAVVFPGACNRESDCVEFS
jgi:hypothetical protein